MDKYDFGKYNNDIWNLLNSFADIADRIESTVEILQNAQECLYDAFDELDSEVDDVKEDLRLCNTRLFEVTHARGHDENNEIEEMPF